MYIFTESDIAKAQAMAMFRAEQSRLKGYSQSGTICSDSAESLAHIDLIGCLGELGFAREMGEPDQLAEGTLKQADHIDRYGTKWHVRATDRVGGCLIVRDHDPIDAKGLFTGRYALVEIDLNTKTAKIAGTCLGKMVRALGVYEARGKSPEPAWWVDQRSLGDIDDYLERKTARARHMTAV